MTRNGWVKSRTPWSSGNCLATVFFERGHINVLETRCYKTWVKWCAKHLPRSRILGLIDSRVPLGAAAKGRSSSPALSRLLRSALPEVIGGRLYLEAFTFFQPRIAATVRLAGGLLPHQRRIPLCGILICARAILIALTSSCVPPGFPSLRRGGCASCFFWERILRGIPDPFLCGLEAISTWSPASRPRRSTRCGSPLTLSAFGLRSICRCRQTPFLHKQTQLRWL